LIFKLHPNEKFDRATKEIKKLVPEAIVLTSGDINEMIANADVLVTQYSSCVYTGIALGKEVHSYFKLDELKQLSPIQNDGASAKIIAELGHSLLRYDVNEIKLRGKKNLKIIDNPIPSILKDSYSKTFSQTVITG
jgi:CDP-glycerol glycerophosphotransferase (TagB/SpsB family)